MRNFIDYSSVISDAYHLHVKKADIIDRKKEILDKVLEYYNLSPKSYLFIGFNPLIFTLSGSCSVTVSHVNESTIQTLNKQRTVHSLKDNHNEKFDCVIAADEFLTFAETDEEQKNNILTLCTLARDVIVTTVKDYKNQDFKDREYSSPAIIKSQSTTTAFTEIHNWDHQDKNKWTTAVYQLQNELAECRGLYSRRTLYFKQLAKFCKDYGATDFLVHKNLMYKSLIKKNYEHVISVRFDN
jgi:hypothetical protein